MTDDPDGSDLDDLRRIAFGRTDTAAGERAAADARRELERMERAEGEPTTNTLSTDEWPVHERSGDAQPGFGAADEAASGGGAVGPKWSPADVGVGFGVGTRPWWPLRSRRNVAILVIAAFVVGAVASAGFMMLRPDGGAGASASSTPSPTRSRPGFDADQIGAGAIGPGGEPDARPSDDASSTAPAVDRAGDARAALRWFDRAQTEADKTTGIGPLESSKGVPVDPASTRLVQTTSVASVWVARGTPSLVNTFCLIIGNVEEHTWGTTCANAADFTAVGLQLTYPSPVSGAAPLTAVWTGTDIILSFGPE